MAAALEGEVGPAPAAVVFDPPLIPGTLIRRYQRFLADVALEGSQDVVTAHCPNSGSMLSVSAPGSPVWLSPADAPGRRLRYTWELVGVNGTLVGINTGRPNRIAAAAIAAGRIPELAGYPMIRREVRVGRNSRIDLMLEAPDRPPCYVEVKNVTLRRGQDGAPVEFPDAVTARGAKHLQELASLAGTGARAVMLYLAQRDDADAFAIAADIDPEYQAGLDAAMAAGVEALCYRCRITTSDIALADRLPLRFP
ncbi:MAG: DNA/RNA nuclease SfsA [Rhodospirillales bacterium]|nr:MAG: DNA/RNA nuclease SfsA [Rhodospirillales bacterium]